MLEDNIVITTKSNKKHKMNVETYARWLCLMEAMQFISIKAEKSKIDLDKNNNWIKPLHLQKYIKERFYSILHDIKIEENLYS